MKTTFTLLVTAVIALSSCGSHSSEPLSEIPPISVKAKTALAQTVSQKVLASGQITAAQSANLSTRLMGHIAQFKVKVGDKVREGQLLVEVSPNDMMAKKEQALAGLAQATAAYENAAKDFRRFTALYQSKSASEKELDNMTTRYEMAKSALSMAQNALKEVEGHLDYAFIRAPFSGVVVNTFGKAGDMAFPGSPLVTLESDEQLEIVAAISEKSIGGLKTGDTARVKVASAPAQFDAVIRELSRSAKNTGGQYLATLSISEAQKKVLPGMFASLEFDTMVTKTDSNEVWIPTEALVQKGQLTGVFVVNENKALLRWLRIGEQRDGHVRVLSGLAAGETYVLSADKPLSDGSLVSL